MKQLHATRLAVTRDACYIEHLQRRFTQEIGFVTRAATLERIKQGNVVIATENGDAAGFLLGATAISNGQHIRPIYQACIQFDAQRRHHGLALLDQLTAAATLHRQTIIQCWCRQELEANDFWNAAGFVKIAMRDVNACRGVPCILWRKPLVKMTAETLAWLPDNVRHHSGGGRSVRRHAYQQLPLIEQFNADQVNGQLQLLELAATTTHRGRSR